MTKRKIKRFLAMFGVLLVLACVCLPTFVGAFSITELSEYNYFNPEVITHPTPSVNNQGALLCNVSDVLDNGFIVINSPENYGGSGSIPASLTGVTLRDICPDMVAGQTYYLSAFYTVYGNENGANDIKVSESIYLNDTSVHWKFNSSYKVTEADLNSRVTFYGVTVSNNDRMGFLDNECRLHLRLWVNKGDMPQKYVSHDMREYFDAIKNEAYNNGYDKGYQEGYEVGTGFLPYLSMTNLSLIQYRYRDKQLNQVVYPAGSSAQGYITYTGDVELTGSNVFSLDELNEDFFYPDGAFGNLYTSDCVVEYRFDRTVGYEPIPIKDFAICVRNDKGPYLVTFLTNERTAPVGEREATNGAYKEVRANEYTLYGEGEYIVGVRVVFYTSADASGECTIDPNASFYISNTNEDMYNLGLAVGTEIGEKDGFDKGYDEGKSDGFDDGYKKGEDYGEDVGYNKGFEKGYDEAQNGTQFYNVIYAAVNAPVKALTSMLNFELFGVDIRLFVASVLTIVLVVAIVTRLLSK